MIIPAIPAIRAGGRFGSSGWVGVGAAGRFAIAGPRAAVEISWQEAVARPAQEQTVAKNCVALLKNTEPQLQSNRGSFVYTDVKAEYDGIIAGARVALINKDRPVSPPNLEARRLRRVEKSELFVTMTEDHVAHTNVGPVNANGGQGN